MSNGGKKYRYPGTRPFETTEKSLFFGRADDSAQLFQQLLNEKTVLLYAKSGLGKSSLINAGVIPLLLQLPQYQIIQVSFGNFNPQEKTYEKPLEKIVAQLNGNDNFEVGTMLDKIIPAENSLWYRLKRQQVAGKNNTVLFIFDQFEELLTYPPEDIFHFKKQFAQLLFSDIPGNIRTVLNRKLEKDPALLSAAELQLLTTPLRTKALFAIRSDRMSELNKIADYFPNILKTFYELNPLHSKQAEDAIKKPAQLQSGNFVSDTFEFRAEVIKNIINSLQDDLTHTIESFQLQMVCHYAENLIAQGKTLKKGEISNQDLGDIQVIFAEKYRSILNELPFQYQYPVQVLIEEKLIVGGNRVPLPEIAILRETGIQQSVINTLLDSHFLRAQLNSVGGRSIELSHDTLIAPVTASLNNRKKEEQLLQQRKEAEEANIKQQAALAAAKAEAETERLRAEEQTTLRKMAEVAKDKAKKNLFLARIVVVAALIFALVSVFFMFQARKASESANEQRTKANNAYAEIKKQQALSRARELKSFGESYEDLNLVELATQNYQGAFDTIRNYPDLAIYQELKTKLQNVNR